MLLLKLFCQSNLPTSQGKHPPRQRPATLAALGGKLYCSDTDDPENQEMNVNMLRLTWLNL